MLGLLESVGLLVIRVIRIVWIVTVITRGLLRLLVLVGLHRRVIKRVIWVVKLIGYSVAPTRPSSSPTIESPLYSPTLVPSLDFF